MGSLAGRGIVVTRPAEQAAGLVELIQAAGGRAILFPTIEITDPPDPGALKAVLARLDDFDLAIFISPSAVTKAFELLEARARLPARLRVAAIGRGSVRALERFGVDSVIAPEQRFDSEGLLESPALADVAGKRVVIFRGGTGRELLGDALIARGARLEYAECYRRRPPRIDAAPLLRAWERHEVDAVVITSSEGLGNLFDMIGKKSEDWLQNTPIFAPHPRIAAAARERGVGETVVTAAGDEGIVAGLADFFAEGARG